MRSLRKHARRSNQTGFTFLEVMAASTILSIFVIAFGSSWVVADRGTEDLIVRQKAIFVANAEMERLTAIYNKTTLGSNAPPTTDGYEPVYSIPTTRRIYKEDMSSYGLASIITSSATTFETGSEFLIYYSNGAAGPDDRNYIWIDRMRGVVGRISWNTTAIVVEPVCDAAGTCNCSGWNGDTNQVLNCLLLDFYLEYPFRKVGENITAPDDFQTVTLSSIVGRY
jgi:prepilin-type N-terminal cleavage/methylation domain-containing protein